MSNTTWMLPENAISRLGQGGMIGNIAPSPDGKCIAVSSCIGVWWYDVSTMTPTALWDTDRGFISAVSFSPNGRWLATGDGDGLVRVWDVYHGGCVAKMDRDETEKSYHLVSYFAFSPDSQFLAVSSRRDYIVYVWHIETGEQIAKLQSETNFRWGSGNTRPIAFSADGRMLACMMPDSRLFDHADRFSRIRTSEHSNDFITIWDMKTNEQLVCLTEPTDFLYSLSFSPCGQFLVAGGRDNTIYIWQVENWKLNETLNEYDFNNIQVSYSQDGVLRAAGVTDDTIAVWNVENGKTHYTYQETDGNIRSANFSNGDKLVFATDSAHNRSIKMWKFGSTKPYSFNYSSVGIPDSLVFSSDGKTLVSACWGRKVMLWDIANLSHSPTRFTPPGENFIVTTSFAGKLYASAPDGNTAKVWEIGNDRIPIASFTLPGQESKLENKERKITSVEYAPKRNLLASADSEGMLYLLDVHSRNILQAFKANDRWINIIKFSPCEKYIVSISRDGGGTHIWDIENAEAIETFPNRAWYVAFSPCSKLVACGQRNEILLWDIDHREIVRTIPQLEDSKDPFALAFSSCSHYLASGTWWQRDVNTEKVAIRLWNVENGENITTFRGHCSDVQELTFSPDGTLLASGGYDGTIMLWDLKPYL